MGASTMALADGLPFGGKEAWINRSASRVSASPDDRAQNNEVGFRVAATGLEANGFEINSGLNDAWYNPATDGQGFLISVFPDRSEMFVAWFTYDTVLPPDDATANLGDPGHRWMTASGAYTDNQAVLNIVLTSGGLFDTPGGVERTDPPGSDGTLIVTFDSCNSGTVDYDIPSISSQGTVPIQRIAPDNIVVCEALNEE